MSDEFAQLARMELIETGKIEMVTPSGVIEHSVKMITGARVRNGVILEIDFAINGSTHTVKGIQSILVNGSVSDLVALFEQNMHNTIENGIISYSLTPS